MTSGFCGPNNSFPAHDSGHAKNAIARARQFRRGAAQRKIIDCACEKLVAKGIITKTCKKYGFALRRRK